MIPAHEGFLRRIRQSLPGLIIKKPAYEELAIICLALIAIAVIAAAGCTAQQPASPAAKSAAVSVTTARQTIAHSGGTGATVYVRMKILRPIPSRT